MDQVELKARMGTRRGGHVVVECLESLGVETVFGVPGTHALSIYDGLRTSHGIRFVGLRTELNAGFAADAHARIARKPAVLLLSTGPGALISLAALMEADRACVPVVAIASQIPTEFIGRGRGYVHELRDQLASARPIVKWAERVRAVETIPAMIAQAFSIATTPPCGPVFLEMPQDILNAVAEIPEIGTLDGQPSAVRSPSESLLAEAVQVVAAAKRPTIWAGGGVIRGDACRELQLLAERISAPVVHTQLGRGALPEDHPLLVLAGHEDGAVADLIEEADVVIAIGTGLAMESTNGYAIRPNGRLIHIDADAARIGCTYKSLALVGDAKPILARLLADLPDCGHAVGEGRATAARARIQSGFEVLEQHAEHALLRTIRRVLPDDSPHAWDLTILGYWAAAYFPCRMPGTFLHAQGSATLGYGLPAALGAAMAAPGRPVLCVTGDGGFLYSIPDLAVAVQHRLPVKVLVVDDGGYGILRQYQRELFGETFAVDLHQPDFASLARSCGMPAVKVDLASIETGLATAFATDGPFLVHLVFSDIEMYKPTR